MSSKPEIDAVNGGASHMETHSSCDSIGMWYEWIDVNAEIMGRVQIWPDAHGPNVISHMRVAEKKQKAVEFGVLFVLSGSHCGTLRRVACWRMQRRHPLG
jgi:hypothetical protein